MLLAGIHAAKVAHDTTTFNEPRLNRTNMLFHQCLLIQHAIARPDQRSRPNLACSFAFMRLGVACAGWPSRQQTERRCLIVEVTFIDVDVEAHLDVKQAFKSTTFLFRRIQRWQVD